MQVSQHSLNHSQSNGGISASPTDASAPSGSSTSSVQRNDSSGQPSESLTSISPINGTGNNGETQRTKPKQKRNKPTLSCLECVERKTKCDRGRPCLACVKRQSTCEYTAVANLIASADRKNASSKARYVTKPPAQIRKTSMSTHSPTAVLASPSRTDNGWPSIDRPRPRAASSSFSKGGSPYLFSNVPYSQSSPSNVFGVGSQHPFANYWTCQGGLPEVISVLPSKEQADILIARYFDSVDPIYPFIHRRTFYSDYELFWALPQEEKGQADASLVALHYAMYATGTQFMQFPAYEERSQTAEFYCSAANQALRVYSYLNRTSMRAIQAMLLMAYFLMNDNHASDAYAWAGIHLRQSYALRLHRDPELVVPEASVLEKQQRRKLWQAVFLHDTFMTILLKLPPTATHSDVPVESLADENELSNDSVDLCLGDHSRVENLMSINVIAPQLSQPPPPPQPHHMIDLATTKSDIAYMRSMWHLGNLVQENLASPLSLSLPIAHSARHKESLVGAFKRLYKSFPPALTILELPVLEHMAVDQPRQVRQNLFLTSNYFHCLMLLHASENTDANVRPNARQTVEAAHEALTAFFKLWRIFHVEASVWWIFQHRAFEESLLVANFLPDLMQESLGGNENGEEAEAVAKALEEGKGDVQRMLEIMEHYAVGLEMHRTRKEVLREALDRIGTGD